MNVVNKKEPILLGFGDLIILLFSLFVTLILRYSSLPDREFLMAHLLPFSVIFSYSLVVFYISGLYGRTINISRSSVPGIVLKSQIANGLIAISLFYFVGAFSVTPKINLFIYLGVSSLFMIVWRLNTYSFLSLRRKIPALVIGEGAEVSELIQEMNHNLRSSLFVKEHIFPRDLKKKILLFAKEGTSFPYIIADTKQREVNDVIPDLYKNYFPKTQIINFSDFYEELFGRVPLSSMNYEWIILNMRSASSKFYEVCKRFIEVIISVFIGICALLCYPFVALFIKLEDNGPVLIKQTRIGKDNKPIYIYKFRSMKYSDNGAWLSDNENKVTRVGSFIRKTRIDELPQALAILKNDLSLIGPRPDIIDLGKKLENKIPYYSVRTIIRPGLSGWAQVNQDKPPQSVEETNLRLSYDIYYIKNRSFNLDVRIALKTIKTLLSRAGM